MGWPKSETNFQFGNISGTWNSIFASSVWWKDSSGNFKLFWTTRHFSIFFSLSQIDADTGACQTYKDLFRLTVRAAKNLQSLNFKKKDIFLFVTGYNETITPLVFAALCLGCPVSSMQTFAKKSEFLQMIQLTKPKAIFCDREQQSMLGECLTELNHDAKIFVFGDSVQDLFCAVANENYFM